MKRSHLHILAVLTAAAGWAIVSAHDSQPRWLAVSTISTTLPPPMDAAGENPWADLWFHSNPIFIEVAKVGGA